MARHVDIDPYTEWLNHVRPTGLIVAPKVLRDHGLIPEPQNRADSDVAAEVLAPVDGETAIDRAWRVCGDLLDWPASRCPGAPGGPTGDDLPSIYLAETQTTIAPNWGLRRGGDADGANWDLLVRVEDRGIEPDKRGALEGWDATAHQRFQRLLQDTGIPIGVLFTDHELRLIYAPSGETAGWIAFPLDPLGQTSGRAMLGGLKLLLHRFRLINDASERRLPALLKSSREAQAEVSEKLSGQILGALHELLRGLDKADPETIRALALSDPHHLYEGVLAVLMRLVFVLYAEDRDLLPSATDGEARAVYDDGYSVRGLFERLKNDEALYPDTMDERRGGWGRLIALFRLIHGGHPDWIVGRGGKLFDPNLYLFLEGRAERSDPPRILEVGDGCLLRILEGLMMLDGERLSYRTLDVEQIGSVYETIIGFTVEVARGPMIAITGGKNRDAPVFLDLEALLATPRDKLSATIADLTDRKLTPKQLKPVREARTVEELAASFGNLIDTRGSPRQQPTAVGEPILQPTDERRRTGSHYTPRTLTGPIVEHALEPVLARLGEHPTAAAILDLKLCDPAMGSGAFLVEACRQLARHVTRAWEHHRDRPPLPPDEDDDLHARRLVAQRCLYGVDRNPMAVDLARMSLWLVTLAAEHEFTFLDHALKVGDSLVGLSLDQIAVVHWDRSKPPTFVGRLVSDHLAEAERARAAIREAEDDVSEAVLSARMRGVDARTEAARLIGDGIVGAFFGAAKQKQRIERVVELQQAILSSDRWGDRVTPYRAILAEPPHPVAPFHWEIEFPEVFRRDEPGFDAIVGNPPFAGKNTIAAGHKDGYGDWLKTVHEGSHGNADLCAHFFRRAWTLLREGGVFGLIATNTIAQGDTRATGLRKIMLEGGNIINATRRMKWPGTAAVVVSVVHVMRGYSDFGLGRRLDGRRVDRISAYLVEGDYDDSPTPLSVNEGKAFIGSYVLGMGFTFDDTDAKGVATPLAQLDELCARNPENKEIVKPYLGGEELNTDPRQRFHRYVIDFRDFPLRRDPNANGWFAESEKSRKNLLKGGIVPRDYPGPVAMDWPDLVAILREKIKGSRADHSTANWWLFERRRSELYERIEKFDRVWAVNCGATPHMTIDDLETGSIFSHTLAVFCFDDFLFFSVAQSRVHEIWARFFSSSLEDRLRYTPSDCFVTFPFPADPAAESALEEIGRAYHDHRAELMIEADEGLTKTYNRFHDPAEKRPSILRLRELHAEMDAAVLRAYGWDDLADTARAEFLKEGEELEFAYQKRLFWPAPVRDEVLARLIDLNRRRAAEEAEGDLLPKGVRRA